MPSHTIMVVNTVSDNASSAADSAETDCQGRDRHRPRPAVLVVGDSPHAGGQRTDDDGGDSPRGHRVKAKGLGGQVGGQRVQRHEQGGQEDSYAEAQPVVAVLFVLTSLSSGIELSLRRLLVQAVALAADRAKSLGVGLEVLEISRDARFREEIAHGSDVSIGRAQLARGRRSDPLDRLHGSLLLLPW